MRATEFVFTHLSLLPSVSRSLCPTVFLLILTCYRITVLPYFRTATVLPQSEIQFCVLDEADLMLQMGFQEPVEQIFKEMPENKQTTLWSATMPRESPTMPMTDRHHV